MSAVLTLLYIVLCIVIVVIVPLLVVPFSSEYGVVTTFDTARAVLLSTTFAFVAGVFIYITEGYRTFLIRLFLVALMIRMVLGTTIFVFNGQEFFGGDAMTYDFFGGAQLHAWGGDKYMQTVANLFTQSGEGSGWGMVYMVAAIYGLIGRNMLAIQLINCVFGAATAIIIFHCAHRMFNNLRVARFASFAVAFYPSLVLWSSQGLKDGPIVFFLALSILSTLKLGEQLSAKHITALIVSLIALLSLRFYVFYMICIAVVGAFVIGVQTVTAKSFARQFVAMLVIGL